MRHAWLALLCATLSTTGEAGSWRSPLRDIETSGASPHHWRGYVNWTSDYVYRGVSLSDSGPARQASIDYHNDNGAFAGWWVSTMEFAPPVGPNTEHNAYLGYSQRWNDVWRSDVSATYFDFRGGQVGPDDSFTQWQLATSCADAATLRLYYADNTYGLRFASHAAELEIPFALNQYWQLGVTLGYWDLENFVDDGYRYTDVSLRYQWHHVSAALHHHSATSVARDTYGDAAQDGWLVMVAIGF